MKIIFIACLFTFTTQLSLAQLQISQPQKSKKGKLYLYWGWNRDWFSKSNITFKGKDHDFVLKNVIADDRQSGFSFEYYFNPKKLTIPQYNFRAGYFINNNWDISFGFDHMKYVVRTNQVATISGFINHSQSNYDGQYSNDPIVIAEDFLKFEHTNGLNYPHVDIRRTEKIAGNYPVTINFITGAGLGILYPKTNTILFNKDEYDEFHISGYGINAIAGLQLNFFDRFFVQGEFKEGFINMPDIRTSVSDTEKAKQSFFFSQLNIVFGGMINLSGKSKSSKKKLIKSLISYPELLFIN